MYLTLQVTKGTMKAHREYRDIFLDSVLVGNLIQFLEPILCMFMDVYGCSWIFWDHASWRPVCITEQLHWSSTTIGNEVYANAKKENQNHLGCF